MCALFLHESTQFIKGVKVPFSTDFRIGCNVGGQAVDFGHKKINVDLSVPFLRFNAVQVEVE